MAVTNVSQQSEIMKKIAECKSGGASNEEIDRPVEVQAILSFATELKKTGQINNLSETEKFALSKAITEAFIFNFTNKKCNCIDDIEKKLSGHPVKNNTELDLMF